VDGTLIEAWAGQKSFQRKGGKTPPPEDGGSNPTVNFHGDERRNDTHRSTTDPEARLFKKSRGSESKLSYMAHVLMENRNGLVVDTRLTKSTGKAERESAWVMAWRVAQGGRRITLGGDKNYDTQQLVASLRGIKATPHVAQNEHAHRSSAIDERTTRHAGYAVSQRKRKRVEEIFGWLKTIAGLRKTKHRGRKTSRMDVHLRSGRVQLGEVTKSHRTRCGLSPRSGHKPQKAAPARAKPTHKTYEAILSLPDSADFPQPARWMPLSDFQLSASF